MNMRNILFIGIMVLVLGACTKEDALKGEWQYKGPVPEIKDGPTEALKMCYALYQKYDLHVYWDIAGEDALKTDQGVVAEYNITYNNRAALPIQAANEQTAEKFLKLLTGFYSLLPENLVRQDLHRRHLLVKVNPGKNTYTNEKGEAYFGNTYGESGIVFYGYLKDDTDETGDKLDTDLTGWKWGICYEFFKGVVSVRYKENIVFPEEYGLISKGFYAYEVEGTGNSCMSRDLFNTEKGGEQGFIHPVAAVNPTYDECNQDWGAMVACILTQPKAERVIVFEKFPKLKSKYEIIKSYFTEYYGIDIEDLATRWQALIID